MKLLKEILTENYDLKITDIYEAPRQFVAETFYISVAGKEKYFCKVVEKPSWIPKIIAGLPVLRDLHNLGIERITVPVETKNGELLVKVEERIVVLYEYISGKQSYDYDMFTFGKLLGEIHAIAKNIEVEIPKERFELDVTMDLGDYISQALRLSKKDQVMKNLYEIIEKNRSEIDDFLQLYYSLCAEMKSKDQDLVLTHGDAGGNVMMTKPNDIYIIDWDEIKLAPKERDLWVSENDKRFFDGYKEVVGNVEINRTARDHAVVSYYLGSLFHYLEAIFESTSQDYKKEKLVELEGYFDGWIKKYMDSITG